jgi:light-independent protochlorophyllide reductase subunit B
MIPEGASVYDLKDLRKAWVNIVPYREVGVMTAQYLHEQFAMPYVDVIPMGVSETEKFIRQLTKAFTEVYGSDRLMAETEAFQQEKELEFEAYIAQQKQYLSQSSWFARSIDCQNLTGKKVVVFGDATHAAGMTKLLSREMGIDVVCAGTYCKHDADWFRDQVKGFTQQVLITDDHTQVGEVITELAPSAIFGTQMERHVGKRLGIPCGVISAPVHIQNYPLAFKPFLGYEGSNQIADLVYNSFSLGMEDHLLEIFGGHDTKEIIQVDGAQASGIRWNEEAGSELAKIPGFVRGRVKNNTEKFASSRQISEITLEVLFAAKESLGA